MWCIAGLLLLSALTGAQEKCVTNGSEAILEFRFKGKIENPDSLLKLTMNSRDLSECLSGKQRPTKNVTISCESVATGNVSVTVPDVKPSDEGTYCLIQHEGNYNTCIKLVVKRTCNEADETPSIGLTNGTTTPTNGTTTPTNGIIAGVIICAISIILLIIISLACYRRRRRQKSKRKQRNADEIPGMELQTTPMMNNHDDDDAVRNL